MNSGEKRTELSRLRLQLRALLADLAQTLRVVLGRAPLIRGNVYEIARRCGTPHCACTRGRLHRNMVITWTEKGKHRLRSIPPARLAAVRQRSEEYLRFRRARAQVSVLLRKILALVDRIQELRREEL